MTTTTVTIDTQKMTKEEAAKQAIAALREGNEALLIGLQTEEESTEMELAVYEAEDDGMAERISCQICGENDSSLRFTL